MTLVYPTSRLTAAQRRTLRTYARIGSVKQTAHELGVSVPTVKHSLTRIYARLGAGCNLDAFRRMGWLKVPEE